MAAFRRVFQGYSKWSLPTSKAQVFEMLSLVVVGFIIQACLHPDTLKQVQYRCPKRLESSKIQETSCT